ncbi:erythromycin esterase-like protein [Saccharothrix coeruleofusca]|uniref:erythromycin esterase family protein n=1 Tax=Saccharothrix coeruleofusca TaxID=33919 RepID=UPI001AE3C960|nr:erythromycin esterase family protein [Saccharothrix coeruleofusca]MBP2338762.1 erythromycin esterase-like protein [Saccharothrix coeruleofusca]
MSQDIRDFTTAPCTLLALGEPTHAEPAFAQVRNELFAQLAAEGFRSIALETDRAAALVVDDYVREGAGTLDQVMAEGFTHDFGSIAANRRLVAWMREHNADLPPRERLAFHGFDIPTETMSAPSPRRHLERARDYLGLDLDLTGLLGDDERWSRTEAVLDPAESIGATPEAVRLRAIADDMLTELYARAPELIAATSPAEWSRTRTHLAAGIDLLRYHHRCAQRVDRRVRLRDLTATRDALMARNLLDIREAEAERGPTLVFAHNLHLRRTPGTMRVGDVDVTWFGVGAVMASLLGERYRVVVGSLGRGKAFELGEPEPDTYEGYLQHRAGTWSLTPTSAIPDARPRADNTTRHYFPLERDVLAGSDAVLHLP